MAGVGKPRELSGLLSIDEAIRSHEAAHTGVMLRRIGRSSDGLHVLELRQAPGALAVPPCGFHRFNIQLSGRQSLLDFEMNRMARPAPKCARPGTISFVPAGRALGSSTAGDDFHAFKVLIPRSLMRRTLDEVLGREVEDEKALFGHIGAPTDCIHRLARLLHDEFRAPGKGDDVMMMSLVQALCVEIARRYGTHDRAEPPDAGLSDADRAVVLALMDKAIGGEVRLRDIADAIGVEPYRLSRQFSAAFGEPPRRHLIRLRLDRARRLLEKTSEPLAEVAAACGFSSQAHMTTSFAKEFGATPARYRAAHRALIAAIETPDEQS